MAPAKTKKQLMLERLDKAILRVLYNADRPLSTMNIADRLGMSSPPIKRRLMGLKRKKLVKSVSNRARRYTRGSTKVSSKQATFWEINYYSA
jgi:DNA-binding GntR family transcriptional regulator